MLWNMYMEQYLSSKLFVNTAYQSLIVNDNQNAFIKGKIHWEEEAKKKSKKNDQPTKIEK